jgi:4-hydroxy-tetrahydrodipicolinate synthase
MDSTVLQGIFPPAVTSFSSTGDVDEGAIRRNVDFLLSRSVHGLFIIGSYGSFPLLTFEERRRVAGTFLSAVRNQVPVIVHVGAAATRHATELAKHAEGIGAAAIASVVPYYYGFAYQPSDLLAHFEKLNSSVRIPVYLYNNPRTTGINVPPQLLRQLTEIGVRGVKDSSGDYAQFAEYLHAVTDVRDFGSFIGTVGLLLPALLLGGRGCVAGTANVFPELIVALWNAFQKRDYDTAIKLQDQALRIRELQGIEGFRPAACYSMLRMRGIDVGTCRSPWRELSQASYEVAREKLDKFGMFAAVA